MNYFFGIICSTSLLVMLFYIRKIKGAFETLERIEQQRQELLARELIMASEPDNPQQNDPIFTGVQTFIQKKTQPESGTRIAISKLYSRYQEWINDPDDFADSGRLLAKHSEFLWGLKDLGIAVIGEDLANPIVKGIRLKNDE